MTTHTSDTSLINKKIFDVERQYVSTTGSAFLNGNPGLLDSINKTLPKVWDLYKKLKLLDWDEKEQNYSECRVEFMAEDRQAADMMIKTIAWQWETDSLAAHHIAPLYAPFVPCSTAWIAICRIQENETLHGLTYSEIVRNSFENPDEVMASVLKDLEPLRRMKTIADVFAEVQQVGAQLVRGELEQSDPRARDAVMLLVCTLFAMERIQFMNSFAITFALADSGRFVPIGKIVQKICNDEFAIHAEVGRELLRNELATEVGRASYVRIKDRVAQVLREICEAEFSFAKDHLFVDGKELVGCNAELLCDFTRYCATDVYNEFPDLENPFGNLTKNPIGYMEDWVNLDNNQGAPQEEKTVNYLLGGFINVADERTFSVEGL